MTVKFHQWLCDVQLGMYANQRLAISLVNAEEGEDLFLGEPIATASVNVEEDIPDDCICIKVHSENSGMLEALQKAGYVGEVVDMIHLQFVSIPIVKKSEKLLQLEQEFRSSLATERKNKM